MVKALDSTYDAGRRGGAWRKVKPVRTLDLVVLAAEWGHGRRRGWLSNLHLGARGPDGTFVMVGKTFKGLTDATLEWQTKELAAREIGRDGITVHVRPELVVEVAVDGVQASSRYAGGVALRFARVRRYRDDKTAEAADPIEAVQALLPGRGAERSSRRGLAGLRRLSQTGPRRVISSRPSSKPKMVEVAAEAFGRGRLGDAHDQCCTCQRNGPGPGVTSCAACDLHDVGMAERRHLRRLVASRRRPPAHGGRPAVAGRATTARTAPG